MGHCHSTEDRCVPCSHSSDCGQGLAHSGGDPPGGTSAGAVPEKQVSPTLQVTACWPHTDSAEGRCLLPPRTAALACLQSVLVMRGDVQLLQGEVCQELACVRLYATAPNHDAFVAGVHL